MNYRQLEAFQAVFRAGSFTLAGKLLFVSQPAVSRLILELEQEIGFKLFERHKNGLQPTPEGQLIFDESSGLSLAFGNWTKSQNPFDYCVKAIYASSLCLGLPI